MISLAKAASRDLGHAGIFIEHATLTESDLDWLCDVERLTLWNVSIPKHFLRKLSALWWIDWRGGNANQGIDQIEEKDGLRYLSLNQIRGLSDLSFINKLMHLEMLNLYGLSKVTLLPSMIASETLRRVQLGQMKNLTSIGPVLEAPNLEEIQPCLSG